MSLLFALSFSTTDTFAGGKDRDKQNRKDNKNIVIAVVSPPVVANGTIAGGPTEIITVLNAPGVDNNLAADPNNFGHSIPAGGRMEVVLGGSFERNGVDNDKPFVPIGSNANFVLVTGLPQMPITAPAGSGVQHGNYSIVDDGDKMITVIPNGKDGLENARAEEIGFKIVHVRPRPNTNAGPSPFTNGPAGSIGTVEISILNKKGKVVEQGSGSVIFPPSLGRRIGPTNVGLATGGQGSPNTTTAELVESVTFQHVVPGTSLVNTVKGATFSDGAPYAPRFLMFEEQAKQPDAFIPMKGIANVGYVVNPDKPWLATVIEDSNGNGIPDPDDNKIGAIKLKGPEEDAAGSILNSSALTTSGDGITGPNGSVLNVPVQLGDEDGVYTVTVSLDNGNAAVTTIVADDD